MADRDKVMNAYIDWSKENDVQVYVMRATPIFGGPDRSSNMEFDWIDLMISPYQVAGNAWDRWLSTESGRKINEDWSETADCQVSMNPLFNMYIDREALSGNTRVMTFNWCTRREGVSWDQLLARHDAMLASRPDDSPINAWTIGYPGLGTRNVPGEFFHLLSFANASGAMAFQNVLANAEGWRQREDYMTSYASCTGENAYHVEVLNRP
jgi:hypothetical protein